MMKKRLMYNQMNEPIDYIFDEDNGDYVEDEDNIHSDSKDEECKTAIALPPFSGYGNGYPLKGAECLKGVYVVKRFNLGIILGPHNRNRKKSAHNYNSGKEEPIVRQDMVAVAVRLATTVIKTHSVNIKSGHLEMDEYKLAENVDISDANLNLKHEGWARHPQWGAQYGRSYLEPYKWDIKRMFDRGACVSTEKMSPCAMLEALQSLYPGHYVGSVMSTEWRTTDFQNKYYLGKFHLQSAHNIN